MGEDLTRHFNFIFDTLEINEKGLAKLLTIIIQNEKGVGIKELCKALNYSEKRIYKLINKLEKLNLIKKSGFPMVITGIPEYSRRFIELINEYIEKSRNRLHQTQDSLKKTVKKLNKITPSEPPTPEVFVSVDSYDDWGLYITPDGTLLRICTAKFHINPSGVRIQRILQSIPSNTLNKFITIAKNKTFQYLYTADAFLQLIHYFKDKLDNYQVLISFLKEWRDEIFANLETRITEVPVNTDFVIMDDSFIYLSIYDPLHPLIMGGKKVSNHPIIQRYIQEFDRLWQNAIPSDEYIKTIDIEEDILQELRLLLFF
ncbi:MAG: DUF6879 family protein [Candidatus Helarchaeota archaeon]